jgi:hypothetical protein
MIEREMILMIQVILSYLEDAKECLGTSHSFMRERYPGGSFINREGIVGGVSVFLSEPGLMGTNPVTIMWEILPSAAFGATTSTISGGNPLIGAATNVVGRLARSVTPLTHRLDQQLFNRGAFDLARRVRREAARVETGSTL